MTVAPRGHLQALAWLSLLFLGCGTRASAGAETGDASESGAESSGEETGTDETGHEETGGEATPCVSGNDNHVTEDGLCVCDDGFEWCSNDPTDLSCCPLGGESTGDGDGDVFDDDSECDAVPIVCGVIDGEQRWDTDADDYSAAYRCFLETMRDGAQDQPFSTAVEFEAGSASYVHRRFFNPASTVVPAMMAMGNEPTFGESEGFLCTLKAPEFFQACLDEPAEGDCTNLDSHNESCDFGVLVCPWD
jgi:hypothetical protein